MHFQSGRVEVGEKEDDGEESMRFEVNFNNPFTSVPVVFVCPEGQPEAVMSDVFGVTVIQDSVSEEGFHVNVGRMAKGETSGWDQSLQINWIAVDSNSPLLQAAVYDVGPKEDEEAESVECNVRFPRAFPRGSKPAVYATCYGGDYPDTFAVCVQYSTTKKAQLNICRGNGEIWDQELKVAVLATTLFPCQTYEVGSAEDNEDACLAFPEISLPGGGEMSRRPVIFTVALHEKGSRYEDAFVCSPGNVTTSGYQINLQRCHPEINSWEQNLRLQCIMIP